MKEIYLDYAATTKPFPEVVEGMCEVLTQTYGNPSSLHKKGIDAENIIKDGKNYFSQILGCSPNDILFTSGGTESNNLAILGAVNANKRNGKRIITTPLEHASVKEVFGYLESQGYEVMLVEVNQDGQVVLDSLQSLITAETVLVSVMHVNNEVGSIQPIEDIGKCIKQANPQVLFHVDAIQSFGKLPVSLSKAKIDLLSISGHKFYGPKGVGVLAKGKQVKLQNMIHGGGQQGNLRSGTENIPGIAGITIAARKVMSDLQGFSEHALACKKRLVEGILNTIPDTYVNGPCYLEAAPHIVNIRFKDVRAEVLLHALEQHGIYVSSGSACASNKKSYSNTLVSIGAEGRALDEAIRFSFGHYVTLEEMDTVLKVLQQQVALLRKYTFRR